MATTTQYMPPRGQRSSPPRQFNRPRSTGPRSTGNGAATRFAPGIDRSLAWFSLGLGVAEVLAPKSLGRMIGVGDHSTMLRMCGVREIATGIGLLSGRAPAAFAMSRVAGDAFDLALLGVALRSRDARPSRVAVAATAVAGVAALDLYASKLDMQEAIASAPEETPITVSLAINAPPQRLYEFWRQLENLPRFMQHIESVEATGERTSLWTAKAPGGVRLQWESEIVDDQPGRCISWRTLEDSEVNHCGSVRFEAAPSGQGSIVRVEMYYGAPGGKLAARAAKMLTTAPEAVVKEDLRRLKQLMETGEIATTRGQPSGVRSVLGRTFNKGLS